MKSHGIIDGSVRRNGKPTSCEPCRISKIRCDHARPTCSRCAQRKLTSKCFYHPAPLTRPRGSKARSGPRQPESTPSSSRAERSHDAQVQNSPAVLSQLHTPGGSSGIVESEPSTAGRGNYLGPSSFLSVFQDVSPNLEVSTYNRSSGSWGRWTSVSTTFAPRLVQLLRPLATYEEMITRNFEECLFNTIPEPLALQPLRLLRTQIESGKWFDDEEALASMITRNTAEKSIVITPHMTPDEFYASFTGENLRWEFVGIIFTLAGLATTTVWYQSDSFLSEADKDAFTEEMAAASNACIEICNQHDNVNDLLIWLYHTHFTLVADAMEELSDYVFRVFGDLISHMYSLGLHRLQASNAEIPFFLSETRKRVFTSCYRTDKNIAMFLGRPPRLPDHYCDTDLPLDLEDESLVLDSESLKQLLRGISADGWSDSPFCPNGNIRPTTAVRVRYRIAKLRERVVALFLGKKTKTFDDELQAVHLDLKQVWQNIPAPFHYHAAGFGDKNPANASVRVITCMEYLQAVSQIERIRCRQTPDAMHNLLDSSMRIVTALIDFIKARKQGGNIQKGYMGVFLLYGLPAAGVLAIELHRCTVQGKPLPSPIPRSNIIRNLSLLVSWFEDANNIMSITQKSCVQVSEVITRLLDETLNHQSGAASRTTEVQHQSGPEGSEGSVNDSITAICPTADNLLLPDDNALNVNTFGTSVEFLDWWDEFWVDGSIPDVVL